MARTDMKHSDQTDTTTKVLATLGGFALGFCALINAVIGGMALIGGHLVGAIGDVSEKAQLDPNLSNSAHHAEMVAKLVAVGFGLLAATEFGAGEFLRRRIRNIFVPIACGLTVVGEAAFSIWAKKFTALDAILIACALFAAWTWSRLPRPQAAQQSFEAEPRLAA
jgi:hypothetical protein